MHTVSDKTEDAILVVSFGTSYNDSREKTIGAIETAIADAFPKWSVRRAFTSRMIIRKLRERDGYRVDTVEEALTHAREDGIRRLVLQPTHLMDGNEYMRVAETAAAWRSQFDQLILGAPLLGNENDDRAVMQIITADTQACDERFVSWGMAVMRQLTPFTVIFSRDCTEPLTGITISARLKRILHWSSCWHSSKQAAITKESCFSR